MTKKTELKLVMLFSALGLISLVWAAEKKEYLLNFSKGELPSPKMIEKEDLSLSDSFVCDYQLTTEHAEAGKKSLKATISKGDPENAPWGKCKFGVTRPKKSDWSNWEMIRFKVYNPQEEIITVSFSLRTVKHGFTYAGRFDKKCFCPPGDSEHEIDIRGAATYERDPLDLKEILEWYFAASPPENKPIILYFSDIELANEEW